MLSDSVLDTVKLVKRNGAVIGNIKSSMKSGRIWIEDGTLPLEEGDALVRMLGGYEEHFIIVDRGYRAGQGGRPGHYEARVLHEAAQPFGAGSTVYRAFDTGAEDSIDYHDHATDVVNITSRNVFAELRNALAQEVTDEQERAKLLAKVDELEQARGSMAFATQYQELLDLLANHLTIIVPFLPVLRQWLSC